MGAMKRALLVSVAFLVLAGCGSSSSSGGGGSSSSSSSSSSSGGSSSAPATANATDAIQNFAFQPDPVKVKVGGTVTWTNKDSTAHNVVFDDKSVKGIANLNQGQSGKVTFTKAGTFSYVCSYHSGMKGTVVVG